MTSSGPLACGVAAVVVLALVQVWQFQNIKERHIILKKQKIVIWFNVFDFLKASWQIGKYSGLENYLLIRKALRV